MAITIVEVRSSKQFAMRQATNDQPALFWDPATGQILVFGTGVVYGMPTPQDGWVHTAAPKSTTGYAPEPMCTCSHSPRCLSGA